MNGNLAFSIRVPVVIVFRENSANSKLSCDAEGDGTNNCTRTEICQLIAMIPHALLCTVVAIYKGRVGNPGLW